MEAALGWGSPIGLGVILMGIGVLLWGVHFHETSTWWRRKDKS